MLGTLLEPTAQEMAQLQLSLSGTCQLVSLLHGQHWHILCLLHGSSSTICTNNRFHSSQSVWISVHGHYAINVVISTDLCSTTTTTRPVLSPSVRVNTRAPLLGPLHLHLHHQIHLNPPSSLLPPGHYCVGTG